MLLAAKLRGEENNEDPKHGAGPPGRSVYVVGGKAVVFGSPRRDGLEGSHSG